METTIQLGDIAVDVVLKDIKNIHLSVYPPNGHVRISAPSRMSLEYIRAYAVTRLQWIKDQQAKIRSQERTSARDFVTGESHFLWGKRYLLTVQEVDSPTCISINRGRLVLTVRPGTSTERRGEFIETWLRSQLKAASTILINKWEPKLGVEVRQFYVQRMRTKWGSCSPDRKAIRLNSELAKKPIECLEYIVVHEMVHLIEPSHNNRFIALMDQNMLKWKYYRDELNRLPVRHEEWKY